MQNWSKALLLQQHRQQQTVRETFHLPYQRGDVTAHTPLILNNTRQKTVSDVLGIARKKKSEIFLDISEWAGSGKRRYLPEKPVLTGEYLPLFVSKAELLRAPVSQTWFFFSPPSLVASKGSVRRLAIATLNLSLSLLTFKFYCCYILFPLLDKLLLIFLFFFFLLFVCLSIISFISLQWTLVTFPSSVAYMNITDVLLFYSRSSIKMRNKSRPDPASNSITSTAILGVFIPCSLFSQGEVLRYQIRDSDLISQVA